MHTDSKDVIRKKVLTLLRNQKEEERVKKSEIIRQRLFVLTEFKRAKTILFYASFDGEVDTLVMMEQALKLKKKVALPIVKKENKKIIPRLIKNLKSVLRGPYGILQPHPESSEPLKLEDLDLVIVPGVVFDKQHHRLGRGLGFYDRFLSRLPASVTTVGLAFDFQIVDHLPHQQKHDVPVSIIVTN